MPLFKPNVEKLKAKGNIKGLIKALGYEKDPVVQREAINALAELGGREAVDALATLMQDADQNKHLRNITAEALGKIGDARAIEPLVGAMDDKLTQSKASRALLAIGDAAVNPLVQALGSDATRLRDQAGWTLEQIGDAAVLPLARALSDRNPEKRKRIVRALERIGDARAVPALLKLLNDAEWHVQSLVVKTLGKIGDARAVGPLVQALGSERLLVRQDATEALVAFGDAAVEPLLRALPDNNVEKRKCIVRALGQISDARAVPVLLDLLSDDGWDDQSLVITALGDIGDGRAIAPLIKVLARDDSNLRRQALKVLRSMRNSQSLSTEQSQKLLALDRKLAEVHADDIEHRDKRVHSDHSEDTCAFVDHYHHDRKQHEDHFDPIEL